MSVSPSAEVKKFTTFTTITEKKLLLNSAQVQFVWTILSDSLGINVFCYC